MFILIVEASPACNWAGFLKQRIMDNITEIGFVDRGYSEEKGLCFKNIFSIKKNDDGAFEIAEECDYYHIEVLTKEQLIKLAEEIKEFANQ